MALVEGTNCGFVAVAPIADPAETGVRAEFRNQVVRFTSPANAGKITEMGWYCSLNDGDDAAYHLGIYDDDGDDLSPTNLLYSDTTHTTGAGTGWMTASGLNWSISPNTTYWLAVWVYDTDGAGDDKNIDRGAIEGITYDAESINTGFSNPYGGLPVYELGYALAIYAVYEEAVGTNMKINISDVFKDIESLKINIGDAWKDVIKIQQNIGDVWKTVFG